MQVDVEAAGRRTTERSVMEGRLKASTQVGLGIRDRQDGYKVKACRAADHADAELLRYRERWA